jgi:hypothetical protein
MTDSGGCSHGILVARPIKVLVTADGAAASNTAEGWSRDMSGDIAGEVLDRAYDADETLTDGTKRFIDRHITAGDKRPPAPSARRGLDEIARKTRA